MTEITLRKLEGQDRKYFARWWRDEDLLKLTSGLLEKISDEEVEMYFSSLLESKDVYHFMIDIHGQTIGHTSLKTIDGDWYEVQIVIGEKEFWGKGYGTQALQLLLKYAEQKGILKLFLEVRPENTRAIRAYEKCGFKSVGIKAYPENKYQPEVIRMEYTRALASLSPF